MRIWHGCDQTSSLVACRGQPYVAHMQLGLFLINIDVCATDPSAAVRIARAAEDAGWESVWTGEHYVLPDPPVPASPAGADLPRARPVRGARPPRGPHPHAAPRHGRHGRALAPSAGAGQAGGVARPGVRRPSPVRHRGGLPRPRVRGLGRAAGPSRSPHRRSAGRHAGRVGRRSRPVHGADVSFSGVRAEPRPLRPGGPPLHVGGYVATSFRRAVTRGHGWYGYALSPAATAEQLLAGLRRALVGTSARRTSARWRCRSPRPPARHSTTRTLAAYAEAGVTRADRAAPREGRRDGRRAGALRRRARCPHRRARGALRRLNRCPRPAQPAWHAAAPWTAARSRCTSEARTPTASGAGRMRRPGRGVRGRRPSRRRPPRPRVGPRPLPAVPGRAGRRRRRRRGHAGRGPVAARTAAPRSRATSRPWPSGPGRAGGRLGEQVPAAHPRGRLPLALAGLHRALEVGGVLDLTVFGGDGEARTDADDDFPGRLFTGWRPDVLDDLLVGAGFTVDEVVVSPRPDGWDAVVGPGHPGPDAARHRRARDAAARLRPEPQRVLRRRRRRLRPPGQPVLARGPGRGDRHHRPLARPGARGPRRGHDRPGEAGDAAGGRADDRRVPGRRRAGSGGWCRGCGRARCASSDWPGGGRRSTGRPSPGCSPLASAACPSTSCRRPAGSTPGSPRPSWPTTCGRPRTWPTAPAEPSVRRHQSM